jgi:enediyne biosynthesis protein E4
VATEVPNAQPQPQKHRRRFWLVGLVVLALLGVAGALLYKKLTGRGEKPQEGEDLWFADVTDEVGIPFAQDPGDVNRWWMAQIHGSGVAVFDFDGDGRLDLYFLNFGGPDSKSINRLYKNMPGGTFKDVTEGSGLGIAGYNTGVIVGDVNNDGWPDVVVVQYNGVKFFLNRGNGTFEDATEESGLRNPLWGTSANLFDFDRDGYLDLVIANFIELDPSQVCRNPTGKRDYCGPSGFRGTVTRLFRNRGAELAKETGPKKARVAFEDVTTKAGLATAPGPGLGVYCADFDGDGWADIFIANDNRPNHLWMNQKNGTFKEEAHLRGIALDAVGQAQAGMGIAVGDIDGDGLFDLYVTHLATERNTLWQQGPKRGQFTDRSGRAGLLATDWRGTGFGTVLCDFDNDGWPDIAVANGAVMRGGAAPNPALGPHFQEFSERNQLFRNEGQGKFRDISEKNKPLCGTGNVARGLATGDLDGDGALDVVVTTIGDRARVFRNVTRARGHWLVVRAFDPRLNRDAYGAEVVVEAAGRRWLRIINPGDSYQSSSDPRAHFGLGAAARFDAIHVLWPDGLAEVFPGGDADRVLPLERGKGQPKRPPG